MLARSLQKHVHRDKFRIHWFDGFPFRITTTYLVGSFTNIGYLWERINKGGKSGYFWSWSLRGCSEPASQARGLAWILEPGIILSYYILLSYYPSSFFFKHKAPEAHYVICLYVVIYVGINATVEAVLAVWGNDGGTKSGEFRKSSKGGGGHFQSKTLCYRFWEL